MPDYIHNLLERTDDITNLPIVVHLMTPAHVWQYLTIIKLHQIYQNLVSTACPLLRRPGIDGCRRTVAPMTSTSESPPTNESDDTSRSTASGSFRLAGVAAFFPASPSGRGVGDQYPQNFCLQGRRHSELVTTQRVCYIQKA